MSKAGLIYKHIIQRNSIQTPAHTNEQRDWSLPLIILHFQIFLECFLAIGTVHRDNLECYDAYNV